MDYFSITYPNSAKRRVVCDKGRSVYFPALDDHISNTIRRLDTFYENDLLEHMYRSIPHSGVFLDVGANIGNHTVFLASFMAEHVVSFEPHPGLFEVLRGVVDKNSLRNV